MDILDAISEATTEANAFTDHAGKTLSLEERILYLQGLSLVMNADNDIHAEEKEYLRILIKSFEMDESILDSCLEFANAPDKDTIQAFFRAFRRKPIAQLFLFDAYVMMGRDEESHEKEINVINKIVEQLEILKGTQQDIYDLFCHIKNRNWQESALYFDSFLLDKKHFQHLLAYYEVDYDELMSATADMRQQRLLEVLSAKLDKGITLGDIVDENSFPADIIIPYLQSRLNRGELRIYQQQVSFTDLAQEPTGEFFNLEGTAIIYDAETESLSLDAKQSFNVGDKVVISFLQFSQELIAERYLLGNSTLLDITTGLQWQRFSVGQQWENNTCIGDAQTYMWDEALEFAKNDNYAGHNDWRLPTIDELKTLIYSSSGLPKTWNDTGMKCQGNFQKPTIHLEAFPNAKVSVMWSSSPFSVDQAWVVNVKNGTTYEEFRQYKKRVRLVRSGQ